MRRALVLLTASLASTSLPAQWGAVSTTGTPAPRSDALLAYDLPNQRMLLFGGNWSNDFYSLQNGVYTALTPASLPGARTRAAIAVDSILGTVVLYGGDGGGSQLALDETWLWNGTDWQLLQTTVSPGGLARHCMAFDVARQETVLFGGRQNSWNSTQAFGDTWVFDGTDWAMATPLNSPPARLNAALAYHPALGGVMLHGGEDPQSGALGDSWWFDGLDWTQLPTTGNQPSPRSKANLVPILGRAVVVLHGGEDPTTLQIQNDTWEHDGSSWRRVDNVYGGIYPARRGAAVAHDFALDRLVAVGGKLANGSLRNDTWEYGAQWAAVRNRLPGLERPAGPRRRLAAAAGVHVHGGGDQPAAQCGGSDHDGRALAPAVGLRFAADAPRPVRHDGLPRLRQRRGRDCGRGGGRGRELELGRAERSRVRRAAVPSAGDRRRPGGQRCRRDRLQRRHDGRRLVGRCSLAERGRAQSSDARNCAFQW